MKLGNREIEDIERLDDRDILEDYEMVPLEPIMYGYGQMNMMPNMGMNPCTAMNPNMDMNPCMGMNQNAYMNPWLGMNPNVGMSSCMDMYPHMDTNMGTYPRMEMRDFDEEIFQDSFNPMNRMYEDAQRLYFSDEDEDLRQPDKYGDTEPFKDGYNNPNKYNPNKYNQKYNDVDSIVRRIERYNPEVFRSLNRYRIPYMEARNMVHRIVRLSLMYGED